FSDFMNRHKVVVPDSLIEQEMTLQSKRPQALVDEFIGYIDQLDEAPEHRQARDRLLDLASQMHLDTQESSLRSIIGPVVTQRVPPRDKKIQYDAAALPKIDAAKQYSAAEIVTGAMKVFARHPAIVSIDSDLASTSGLEAGVAAVDQKRALNVGVAEANMMAIGEAFAALGYNTWVSTFCPFFNWQ